MKKGIIAALFAVCLTAGTAARAEMSGFGLHGGIGFDTSLGGLAYGGGVSYLLPGSLAKVPQELGLMFHAASNVRTEQDDTDPFETTYTDQLAVLSLRYNALFNYDPEETGPFFILGSGLGAVNYYHREKEKSLAVWYVTGYDREVEGTAMAIILNPGFGIHFGGGMEARLELPIFTLFGGAGSAVAMTGTATLGYRF